MVVIKNSMQDDLKAAQEGGNSYSNGKNQPDISGTENENVIATLEEAPASEETGIIKDDYVGNISYEALKSQKADMPQYQDTELQNLDGGEGQKETVGIVFNSEKTNNGNSESSLPDMKENIVSKLVNKKFIVVGLAVVLMICAAFAFLQNKNTAIQQKSGAAGNNQAADGMASDLQKVENANDALRIQNINAIARAVALYYLNEKVDMPVSPNYIKLNETNPVTDFIHEALKKNGQLDDILLDPRNPGFYYTYRSLDGRTIEFGARMEDLKSIDCNDQSPCIYQKVLTEDDIRKMGAELEKNEK